MELDKSSEEGALASWSLRGTTTRLILRMSKTADCK